MRAEDEDLLDQKDLVVMPAVGTVTYLSSVGAPLVAAASGAVPAAVDAVLRLMS